MKCLQTGLSGGVIYRMMVARHRQEKMGSGERNVLLEGHFRTPSLRVVAELYRKRNTEVTYSEGI